MPHFQTEIFRRFSAPLLFVIGLSAARPALASKWTGPQFVVVEVEVTATAPCPTQNITIENTEWIIDRVPGCVLYKARPKKVRELVSSWNKDPEPYLKGTYHFAAKKGALRLKQSALVLLQPGPRYEGKLDIVGQTMKARVVAAQSLFFHSEINVVNANGERLRLELRFAQKQIGKLSASPQKGYSLLVELKKSCVELGKAVHVELTNDCVGYADFRYINGARVFQTNRVRGAIDFAARSYANGFGPFVGRVDIIGDGNPELENSQGTEKARFSISENGDFEELTR